MTYQIKIAYHFEFLHNVIKYHEMTQFILTILSATWFLHLCTLFKMRKTTHIKAWEWGRWRMRWLIRRCWSDGSKESEEVEERQSRRQSHCTKHWNFKMECYDTHLEGRVCAKAVSTADPINPYANLYINSSDLYYDLYLIWCCIQSLKSRKSLLKWDE